MEGIVDTVVVIVIAVVGAALARRLGFVAPLVLLVAGLGLSFVPGLPEIHVEPELVLIGILPPLLYVAALQTSVPAFRRALRPIILLAVGLVVFTGVLVGFALHWLMPDVPLAACIALGAVVAPPDAVSATAIARRIGLPRHIVTILEGESLLNDATALVLMRVSAGALTGIAAGFWEIGRDVVLTAGGGLLFGLIVALRFVWMYPASYLARLLPQRRNRQVQPSLREPAVLAWAGMRGVVTLAAVLSLPDPSEVPGGYPRDLFVFVAFAVIVLTLLLQGTTLPILARRLGVHEDTSVADALAEASVQNQASRAALKALEDNIDGAPDSVVERLRGIAENRNNGAWERLGSQEQETPSAAYGRLRREMITAERHVFKIARNEGRIPEEVLTRAQRDLDLEESQLTRSDDE
jgi:CPA1 family monovalent cation:H+ antiporter